MLTASLIGLVATPSDAAPSLLHQIDNSGDQQSGRWIVYDLPADVTAVDIVAWWEGNGDVNLFLKDEDGRTLAFDNERDGAGSSAEQPASLRYNGSVRPATLAVLVKTGQADYTVRVWPYGQAPYFNDDPTPEPPPPPSAAADYAGQPSPGTLLWGAHIKGDADPAIHEDPAGATMGVNRIFFQWRHRTGYAISTAQDDVRAGRVPWLSFKTPRWNDMASGRHDAEIDEMLRALDALEGPVWLTMHHEPEGGGGVNSADDPGGPSAHVAMNRRVRQRMDRLGTDNIALAPILMAFTWTSYSGRNPEVWWDDGIYDFLGVDDYARNESDNLLTDNFFKVREWADGKDVDMAIAEWNMPGDDQAAYNRFTQLYDSAVGSATDGRGAQVVGLAVYDSSWTHGTRLRASRLRAFHDLMGRATSVTQN